MLDDEERFGSSGIFECPDVQAKPEIDLPGSGG